MKNYMKTLVEKYFAKNMATINSVGDEHFPIEMLKRNSFNLLNVSPRFF